MKTKRSKKRDKRTQPGNNQPEPPILPKCQPSTKPKHHRLQHQNHGGKVDHQTAETMLDTWASRLAPARTPWAFDPKAKQEWLKRLTDYQPPIARETWEQWRRHNDQWPSLYTFDDMLKARTRAGQHQDDCPECDNTGWVEAPSFVNNGHTYSAVQPCTCRNGEQRRTTKVWTERNG